MKDDKLPAFLTKQQRDRLVELCSVEDRFPVALGRRKLERELGLSEHQARKLAALIQDNPPGELEGRVRVASTDKQTQLDKLKRKVAALEAENEQLMDAVTGKHILADAIVRAAEAMDPIDIAVVFDSPYIRDDSLDAEDVILPVSDVQLGERVDALLTGGLGSYNFDTFKQRFQHYMETVDKILRYVPNPLERGWLVLGGDIVDGSTIYRGQQRQIDLPVTRQVVAAYEHFAQLVAYLSQLFPHVDVVVVPGNHGRIGMRGEFGHSDNLDWLLGWFLKERFRDSDRVTFHMNETWWSLFRVRQTLFYAAHGDEFRRWLGFPFYGATRFAERVSNLLKKRFGVEAIPDKFILSHHHEQCDIPGIYMNGCWPGGSEFSLHDLQVGADATQWMLGVHDRHGVSWTRTIDLAYKETRPSPPIIVGGQE